MKINIKYFASTREITNMSQLQLDQLPQNFTTNDLLDTLVSQFPLLQSGIREISLAVNKVYVKESIILVSQYIHCFTL